MALNQKRSHALTLGEIMREPVYERLAGTIGFKACKAVIDEDIKALRAAGELIEYKARRSDGELAYHLDTAGGIRVDTSGLSVDLLVPLLGYKGDSELEAFAQIGVRKALAAGDKSGGASPLTFAMPSGRYVPAIAAALQRRQWLRFAYHSLGSATAKEYVVDPVQLEIHHDHFYLSAFVISKESQALNNCDQLITFRLDRIAHCTIVAPELNSSPRPNCAADATHNNPWFAPVNVVFRAQPGSALPLVSRAQAIPGEEDTFLLQGADRHSIIEEIAFYGQAVELLEPDDLRARMRENLNWLSQILTENNGSAAAPTASSAVTAAPRATGASCPDRSAVIDKTLSRRESYYSYLLRRGHTTLGELAKHFAVDPKVVCRELHELYITEIRTGDGGATALFDFIMPEWEHDQPVDPNWEIEAVPSIWANQISALDQGMVFSLVEVVSVLAAVDSLLTVALGDYRRVLLELRDRFVTAAQTAGYGSCLWPSPAAKFEPNIVRAIVAAIEDQQEVELTYWKSADTGQAQPSSRIVKPFAIDPAAHPYVVAQHDDGVIRTYRLDRISAVTFSAKRYPKTPVRAWLKSYRKGSTAFSGTPVQLLCTPRARWASEEIPGAQYRLDTASNTAIISFTVASLPWLLTLLVQLGPEVLAVAPAEVGQELLTRVLALAAVYGEDIRDGERQVSKGAAVE